MAYPAHIEYTLQLADHALILGHRNSEWTGHGPILEQDIALSNVALDLIGQARYLYQHAAGLIANGGTEDGPGLGPDVTEDTLAFSPDAWYYRHRLSVHQTSG